MTDSQPEITVLTILKALYGIHKSRFPARSRETLEKLGEITPGMNGTAISLMIENLRQLKDGRIVILSGPVGCGKTIASYVGVLLYEWTCSLGEQWEMNKRSWLSEEFGYECEEFGIEKGTMEQMTFGLTIARYGRRCRNSPNFVLVRAFDILKDAIRTDSRRLALFKGIIAIDDVGREYFTDRGFGIAEWDQFFDLRYSEMLPTIITTNMTPQEFVEKYNQRIYDRLRECANWITIAEKSLRRATI